MIPPSRDRVASLGTILGVWADAGRAFAASGGLMAAARSHGQRVVLVVTSAGNGDLRAILDATGVIEHLVLGHAPAAAELLRIIGEVGPDTIVTHGPGSAHRDERTLGVWVGEAVRQLPTGRRPRVLHLTEAAETPVTSDLHDLTTPSPRTAALVGASFQPCRT